MGRSMTLAELQARGSGGNSGNQGGQQRFRSGGAARSNSYRSTGGLFGGMDGEQDKHPRQENFCDMWTTTFCPNFSCKSFIALLVVLEIMLYIASLVHTSLLDEGLEDTFFLGISDETLQNFGMRMPDKIKNDYAVHRLLLASILNYGFQTVCINVLITMVIGFMIEAPLGSFRMCIFYLISVIGGNLFGCMVSDKYAVGSEPFIFSMFAALLGMFAVYWDRLGENMSRKFCMIFLVVLLLIIAILFLTSMAEEYAFYAIKRNLEYPDIGGSVGGFLFGLFASFALLPPTDQGFLKGSSSNKCVTIVGLICTIALFIICATVFFTSD